jgi:hypothetical protein
VQIDMDTIRCVAEEEAQAVYPDKTISGKKPSTVQRLGLRGAFVRGALFAASRINLRLQMEGLDDL